MTLIGAGGIGKTTLSLEVACRTAAHYSDSAWLIELAPLTTSESLPSVVLSSIKLSRRPGPGTMESLVATLNGQDVLLVLDNCEHLVDSAADFAGALLRHCPSVRNLATSREVLNVTGVATRRG